MKKKQPKAPKRKPTRRVLDNTRWLQRPRESVVLTLSAGRHKTPPPNGPDLPWDG